MSEIVGFINAFESFPTVFNPVKLLATSLQSENIESSNIKSINTSSVNLDVTSSNAVINGVQIATVDYVDNRFAELIGSAPETLNTLTEIANAINNDGNVYNSLTNSITLKADTISVNAKTATIDISINDIIATKASLNYVDTQDASLLALIDTNTSNITLKADKLITNTKLSAIDLSLNDIISTKATINYVDTQDATLLALIDTNTSNITLKADTITVNTKLSDIDISLNDIIATKSTIDYVDTKTALLESSVNSNTASLATITTSINTNTTSIASLETSKATKSYVDTSISSLVNGATTSLDTLNELATALGNDSNFSTTITNLIGTKANTSALATYQPLITGTSNLSLNNIIVNGQLNVQEICESIISTSVATNIANISYSSGGIFYLTPSSATNMTVNITNIPINASFKTYSLTLLIETASLKQYANTFKLNNVSYTPIFVNGLANVDISSSTMVIQTLYILFTASSTVPYKLITSISSVF